MPLCPEFTISLLRKRDASFPARVSMLTQTGYEISLFDCKYGKGVGIQIQLRQHNSLIINIENVNIWVFLFYYIEYMSCRPALSVIFNSNNHEIHCLLVSAYWCEQEKSPFYSLINLWNLKITACTVVLMNIVLVNG